MSPEGEEVRKEEERKEGTIKGRKEKLGRDDGGN